MVLPQTPLHGFITPLSCTKENLSNLSSTCQFHCDSNHTLVGQNILTCLASGEWSEVIPVCKGNNWDLALRYFALKAFDKQALYVVFILYLAVK